MPAKLTPKQEKFCQVYVETGNASESYRRAYDASGMSDNAIGVEAHRRLKDSKISLRIQELGKPAAEAHGLTQERIMQELAKIALADHTDEDECVRAADKTKALELAGKRMAMWIDRTQSDTGGVMAFLKTLPVDLQSQVIAFYESSGAGDA